MPRSNYTGHSLSPIGVEISTHIRCHTQIHSSNSYLSLGEGVWAAFVANHIIVYITRLVPQYSCGH